MPATGEKYFYISSLVKGLRVLELLSENKSLTVTEVARQLSFNRATAHRFLSTLKEIGYVEKDERERYQATIRVFEIGMKVAENFEIRRIAKPFMEEFSNAFKETINLGFLDGSDVFHLDKIESKEVLHVDTPLGSRAPAYCTALGKAILSFLPEKQLDKYLKNTVLKPIGPHTIVNVNKLRKELQDIRQRGFATDLEELSVGLCCLAAPIFDHNKQPVYAISVSGPSVRMTVDHMQSIYSKLIDGCNRLSKKLGGLNSSL